MQPTLPELIALRQRVQAWPPPERAAGARAAQATAPVRGRGMDYAESRLYAQGDDARHIDWRVTARTGRTHTKVFHAERDRVTLLVADTAATLYVGTRRCYKSVQAARTGALAAWAAERSGDRIAILRGSAGESVRPPAGGSRGALRALDALVRWYAAPPPDDAGLDHALEHAARASKPGARVLALVDPRSIEAVPDARWRALSGHHDAIAVLFTDPLELAPPNARVTFANGDRRVELDLADAGTRAHWQQAFADRLASARDRLKHLGWRTLTLSTTDPPEQVLAALLPRRREAS